MNNILQRLTIIKACISLADEDLLSAQSKQLKVLVAELETNKGSELQHIIYALDSFNYPEALNYIQQFITKMTNVAVYQDHEISALKLELAGLEQQLSQLHIERDDYLNSFDEFNREYSLRLGMIINEVLQLRRTLWSKKIQESKDAKETAQFEQEYEQITNDYEEFNHDYQEELNKPAPIQLTKDDNKRLKKAFKHASRLCHPDTVADNLKEKATQVFQVLNEAYQNKDLAKVEEILAKLQIEGIFNTASEQVDDKDKLKQYIATLRERIASIDEELATLKSEEIYQLITSSDGDYEAYMTEKETVLQLELEDLRAKVLVSSD